LYSCIIGGEKVISSSGSTFRDVNPADTDEVLAEFPMLTRDDVARAIDFAREAQLRWASTPAPERGRILLRAAQVVENEAEELARTLTREEGKTLSESRAEVSRVISIFRFYGVMGYRLKGDVAPSAESNTHLFTIREPLGVVSIITPWNFPIAIPSWKMAPALICGNAVIFKPASYTPLIGYRLAEALHKAGLPPGVLNFVTGGGSSIGTEMITNPQISAISFTGSLEVGEEIRRAAAAGRGARVQLELGGKNPAVVLDDADLDKAVEMVVRGAFGLTGQACTATSRAIIHEKVYEEFVRKLVERARRIRVGNGLEEGVEMGPVVGEKEMDKILSYIETGKSEGAKLIYGGRRLKEGALSKGYFIEPTIFTEVTPDMRIAQEEIFGPVLGLMRASSFDDALDLANKTEYGLSASVFTKSLQRAFDFARMIEAGVVKVNKPTTGLEPHVPFGGFKKSSYGMIKEQGEAALDFYTRIKTVYLSY
jgi:acyl-CoA reductase-like NAD-dependent aldehyde dehydrogenase